MAVFPVDPHMRDWARACQAPAQRLLQDPQLAQWYRCQGTWFAGVNALPNDASGAIDGVLPALAGAAIDFIQQQLGHVAVQWDRAQISVNFPGYPRQGPEDSESSFRFRRDRMAAHVDGLERVMPGRRRRLSETHSFLLGIPLGDYAVDQAPLVYWRGSHEIIRAALREALAGIEAAQWRDVDITQAYTQARRACFAQCDCLPVVAPLGSASVMHPLTLHGVAPWRREVPRAPLRAVPHDDSPEHALHSARAIAYFRPDAFGGDPRRWLDC